MIISGTQIKSIMKVYAEQDKTLKTAKTQGSAPASKKDEVILSSQAQEFSQINQSVKTMPEVRQDKVDDLSKRIANGDYSVDAKDVAEKMLGRILADNLE